VQHTVKKPLEIILASSSPRRRQLLESLGISFKIVPANFDEESISFDGDPEEYVTILAKGKVDIIRKLHPKSFVLAADTTVYAFGKVINKPQDLNDAKKMLTILSGATHTVYTGVALALGDTVQTAVERTEVRFFPLTEEQIDTYVNTQHVLDKAGGYAIQGAGALIVERIDGCYYNVVGLPLSTVSRLLSTFGCNLWEYVC